MPASRAPSSAPSASRRPWKRGLFPHRGYTPRHDHASGAPAHPRRRVGNPRGRARARLLRSAWRHAQFRSPPRRRRRHARLRTQHHAGAGAAPERAGGDRGAHRSPQPGRSHPDPVGGARRAARRQALRRAAAAVDRRAAPGPAGPRDPRQRNGGAADRVPALRRATASARRGGGVGVLGADPSAREEPHRRRHHRVGRDPLIGRRLGAAIRRPLRGPSRATARGPGASHRRRRSVAATAARGTS